MGLSHFVLDEYVVCIGKYKGKKLEEIPLKELDSYLGWIDTQQNIGVALLELRGILMQYLEHYADELEKELN